jgi:thiol-disulfide isomerase/thioredoxin
LKTGRAIVVVAVLAVVAGYFAYAWHERHAGPPVEAQVWSRTFPDLAGAAQPLSQWRGKTLVINFWATWCEPCRKEIPLFVKLQQEYGARGVQFVGIAIDQPDKVRAFARDYRMNYPVLLGGMDAAEWSQRLGNSAAALPYTLLIGPEGQVRMNHVGMLDEAMILPYLLALSAK